MKNKSILIIFFIVILLMVFTLPVKAVTVNKETIKKNLESYAMTGKVASTIVGNSKFTVGGDAAKISSLAITDNTITFLSSDSPMVYNYTINGNLCTFKAEVDINPETKTEEYVSARLKTNLLSACFLAITDSYDIASDDALYYYVEKSEQTKLNIDYEGIDNKNYVGLSQRYVAQVGKVEDTIFRQYTKVLVNNEQNCKYETILEINLDQVSNLKVQRPVDKQPEPQTNTLVPVVKNEVSNNTTTENTNNIENQISQNEIANATDLTEVTDDGKEQGNNVEEEKSGFSIGKVILVVAIVAFFVIGIIVIEKRNR